MDKDFSSVGTQYIICECGDNFPNENFLSIHLANGHGEVDTFLCDACPEAFTSNNLLLQHKLTHKTETGILPKSQMINVQTPKKPALKTLKTYNGPLAKKPEKMKDDKREMEKNQIDRKPPVIKVQTLKKINSISLIQSLKAYGKFIKIEPEPEPPETPAVVEREAPPVLVKSEMEAETPAVVEREEPQLLVKSEMEAEPDPEDTEEIYYQCDVCNAIFYTEMDFNVHYQSQHALKQEPAHSAEHILEQHLVMDHGDTVAVQAGADTVYYYECEVCHKIFANEKYFNIHYNKTHGGSLPADEPHYVDVTQPDDTLSAELAAQSSVAEEPEAEAPAQIVYYKCDLCKILYPSEKAYNTHFDKKHGGSCRELQTTGFHFIEQDLTAEYRLKPKTKTPPEPKSYPCEFCPKIFNLKRSLQVHRKRVHFDKVKETDGLTESSRAANRSKVCDICGRAYNSNAALRYHQRRHTGEKPYPCTVCCKRFTMPMFLQIHMRTHTGEKPYECPHCPKAFTNKAALIRHDRVHTGVKPYECPECGKFFTQSNSMKLHVSTVHLKLPAPYKSRSRRNKSEARALQIALKGLSTDEHDTLILGE